MEMGLISFLDTLWNEERDIYWKLRIDKSLKQILSTTTDLAGLAGGGGGGEMSSL